jgi:hypothetical protein
LTKYGIEKVKDDFKPKNLEEAISMNKEDAKFNETMQFVLTSIEQMIDKDLVTGMYDYDGSESTAKNKDGESYQRKFTHVFKGKFKDFEINGDGISFKGKAVISFTMQECLSDQNCPDE